MTEAKSGDTVRVHYTGTLADGSIFDTSMDRDPLQFTIGEEQIIPAFERAVVGMNPGESKTIMIPSGEAYGPHQEEMVLVVERDQFPPDLKPEVGQQLQMRRGDEHTIVVRVTEVSESDVTLDANHPLAGKDLTFDLQLVDIV
ncbi:MAG: peptidylprolyl isomerase [Candidatus Tectomicrobia bacterium]|uniref:Peptidyl-prolyl cis-trans isomerase n=1 Tax=Tectimicrobiota bacterium TaxID=2528274 RepID=A0A932M1Y6_UNCTE|nr:peptidylprolyl isomerase [Candidatus Tectomicrobia bacterium]